MKLIKYPKQLAVLLISFFLLACSLSKDIQLSSYAQKQQLHEIINTLQPGLDKGDTLPSFQLFLLAASYNGIRNYSKALATTDLLQKQIDQGDRGYVGADLTVYPQILRGSVYLDQGEPQKAIQEGALAYKLLHEDGRDRQNFYKSQLISIYDFLGVAHALAGNNADAQKIADSLQNVSIDAMNVMNGPPKYTALARIYMALKEYDHALTAIRNPDAKVTGLITAFFDQTFQEIPKLYILSKSLYETGNIKEAKEGYDQLLGHPQIEQIGGIYWIVLLDRARIALSEGQKTTAEDMLKKAIAVIEKHRSTINTEAGRIGFVGDKQAVYSELIALLLVDGCYTEAFAYVERAKARALVDLLASQNNLSERGGQTSTLAQLDQAENKQNIVAGADDKEGVSKTRSVVLALKKDLRENAPELASLVTVATPATAEIQDKLSANETLLEYYSSGNDWYVFIVTRQTIIAQKLAAPDLESNITSLRQNITSRNATTFNRQSQILYRQLLASALPAVKTKKLIIVPHGALHYLPFAALSDGREYLIDRFSIRMLPSASVLNFLQTRVKKVGAGAALIFGNPKLGDPKYDLNFAQDEALAIGKIIPKSNVLLRSEASETNLKKYGGNYPIIHLAVHGIFDLDKPLDSALLLAGDKDNDGMLKAGDLYNLSLNADLVTLSACETALGKVATGDDVVGFTRGFLYAGARSLISSLWQVDDQATRDLMVSFYSNLTKMSKDEALREAQIKVKKQYPQPFYWAAFLLTGSAI